MQRHDTGTRSTLRLATGMAATLAVASLALVTIVTAEHRENGRWVGTWSASPQAVASPVQTAIASDRQTMATGNSGSGPGATHCTSRTSAFPD